jgi:hypothetical protein
MSILHLLTAPRRFLVGQAVSPVTAGCSRRSVAQADNRLRAAWKGGCCVGRGLRIENRLNFHFAKSMLVQSLEELHDLLAQDIRIDGQKCVDTLASFQEIDEGLNRDPRTCKACGTVHDIFVDGDHGP